MKTNFKQTAIDGIPEGWELVTLRNVARVNELTISKEYPFDEIEYIDISSVDKGSLLGIQKLFRNEAPSRAQRIVKDNDILLSTVRPNLKHFAYIERTKPNLIASTGFAVISAKKINPRYLYYYLTTDSYTNFLSAIADTHTSAYPAYNPDVLENSQIPVPSDSNEQRVIAKILSDLDAKIELNRRMNETLEHIARAIFKKWFVDFEFPGYEKAKFVDGLPEGWQVGQFGELARIQPGFAFKSQDFTANGYKIIKIRNIQNGVVDVAQTDYVSEDIYHSVDQKFHLVSGDAIIAMTGAEIGKIGIIPKTDDVMLLNQRVGKLVSDYFLWAYFMLNGSEIQSLIQGISSASSAQPNISNSDIEKTNVIIPAAGILEQFSQIGHSPYEKTIENLAENQTISQIRDTLLPKLMSGKTRV